jgi:hypothetical protein
MCDFFSWIEKDGKLYYLTFVFDASPNDYRIKPEQ